ncbi:EpsG family protein [Algibacter sp. Ld11]|uniref:EpsG family protein n=1 Tax=Algibacter sp. Ld11 TaxID=649150 RepID=UPI0038659316
MFDFIPIEDYSLYHYIFLLLVCVITLFHTIVLKGDEQIIMKYNKFFGITVLMVLVLYIGLRPIHGEFVDMMTYNKAFLQFQTGVRTTAPEGDLGFGYFLVLCSKIMSVELFFFICAIIYILPLYIASKNWFPEYYFFIFLLLVASMSFWTYGVNGIRNGMATSLFILAISYVYKNKKLAILFFIISLSFHKSMYLLMISYIITFYIKEPKFYYFFWFLAIVLSISMGGVWEMVFANLGFGDDKLTSYLTTEVDSKKFRSTGFRYDFLIYSAAPLIISYFYVFKKKFHDLQYNRVLHTYMIANGFWIMIIRANFSNRFAYLSWFLMAIVIGYPLFKQAFLTNQFRKVGIITSLYFAFTFFMYFYFNTPTK